jgi:hypothetical protein
VNCNVEMMAEKCGILGKCAIFGEIAEHVIMKEVGI